MRKKEKTELQPKRLDRAHQCLRLHLNNHPVSDILSLHHISLSTFYRYLDLAWKEIITARAHKQNVRIMLFAKLQ